MQKVNFVLLSGENNEELQYKIYPDIETALFIGREVDKNFPNHPVFYRAEGEVKSFKFPYSKVESLVQKEKLEIPSWYKDPEKRKKVFIKAAYEYVLSASSLYKDFYIESALKNLKTYYSYLEADEDTRYYYYINGAKRYDDIPYEKDIRKGEFFQTVEGKTFQHLQKAINALSQALTYTIAPVDKILEVDLRRKRHELLRVKPEEQENWIKAKRSVIEATMLSFNHMYSAQAVIYCMIAYELQQKTPPFLDELLKKRVQID